MSLDRHEPGLEEMLDELWRRGLEGLVGEAQPPDGVWDRLFHQVQAGPPRPRPRSRAGSRRWRALGQLVALAGVFLLVFSFRAEMLRQGSADILTWRDWSPARVTHAPTDEPIALGLEDTLSERDRFQALQSVQPLRVLHNPSMDPLLRAREVGASAVGPAPVDEELLRPRQDQVIVHRRDAPRRATVDEALYPLFSPVQDPTLSHLGR